MYFFMQAGFAMVEAGLTRAKNAINIMMKNLMDFSMGSLAFWAIGFGIMFGVSKTGWFGTSGFFLSDFTPDGDPWVLAFWMFQVVFAATAACFLWVFPAAFIMFKLIDKTVGLRVSKEEEREGLDFSEHGGNAYPDFATTSHGGMTAGGFGGGNAYQTEYAGAVSSAEPVSAT